jgi:ABC-type glycerol-3-phosphate transport system substrate-binding protein
MKNTIDKNSKVPLYVQVKDYLLELIEKELRGKASKLPPEIEISRTFGISRATVRTAIMDLVKDGLIERVPGKGTFIKENKKILTFTSWNLIERPMADALSNIIERFSTERRETRIKTVGIPYEKTEYQLMAMAMSGKAPDIATLIYFWLPVFTHPEALCPLDEIYTPAVIDNLYPQTLANVRAKGRMYGFNWVNAPSILYFNKRVHGECFGPESTLPDDHEQLREYVVKVAEKSRGTVIPFSIPVFEDEIFFLGLIYSFLLAFEGGVVDGDGEVILNSEANIKAFAWLKTLLKTGNVDTSHSFRETRQLFANNKIALIIDDPYLKGMIPILGTYDPLPEDQVGYSTLPKGPKGVSCSILWNHVLAVFKQCGNRDLAFDFIRHLVLNAKNAELYYRTTGMLPVIADEINNNPVYRDRFGTVLKKQMETAFPVPANHPSFLLSITFCAKASREILLGDEDIRMTLNNYAEIVRELYRD